MPRTTKENVAYTKSTPWASLNSIKYITHAVNEPSANETLFTT